VRLQVAYCGICGTDIHEFVAGPILLPTKDTPNKHTGATLPLIMGHEMSGIVLELGSNVSDMRVGQRVAVNPAMDDRHHGTTPCELCTAGRHNICTRSTFYGLQAPTGGLADEICVDRLAVMELPDNVSLKLASLAEPMAVATHMVRISGFKKGQNVVVFGAGPIGCALTLILKDQGAGCVLVSEVLTSRAAQAKACGADRVLDPSSNESLVWNTTLELMSPGADIAFDACGLQVTLDEAFRCTKPGGTVFNVAIHERPLTLNLNLITLAEKRLMGGNAYTREDFENVIQLLGRRSAEIEAFISHIVPLDEAVVGGFEELVRNKAHHSKILVEVHGGST